MTSNHIEELIDQEYTKKKKLYGAIPTFQYLGHWMPCQTELYCKDKTDQAPLY